MAYKITLRTKPVTGKKTLHLYLNYSPEAPHSKTGKLVRKEYLGLHLYQPEKTVKRSGRSEKEVFDSNPIFNAQKERHNKEQQAIAQAILNNRLNELNKPEIYGRQERKAIEAEKRQQLSFLDFYNQYSERKKLKGQRIQGAAFQWYKRFNKGKQIAFSQITVEHLEEYKFFLEQQITSGELASYTGSQYFDHLKMAINEAERFDYLSNNPNNKVKEIKVIKKESTFLTEEELSQLENLPCTSETVKRACLFAAYTGLRRGDVMGLTWEMIVEISPNNFSLKKLIEKANKFEVIPLSNKALSFLGYRLEPTSRVFWFSNYDLSKHLKPWVSQLKNGKKVTFHTFRHSFASNLLLKGEPITNVSKLLTHSTVTQTLNTYSHVNSEHLRKTTNQFS